jgi:hypothetical protein
LENFLGAKFRAERARISKKSEEFENLRNFRGAGNGARKVFKTIHIPKIMGLNLRTIDTTNEAFSVDGKPVVVRAVGEYSPDLKTYTLQEYLRVGDKEILRGRAVVQDARRLYFDEGVNIEQLAKEELGKVIGDVSILQQIASLL